MRPKGRRVRVAYRTSTRSRDDAPAWRFALFLAYFLATRSVFLLTLAARGRRAQWRATVRGMVDYFRGRLGRTYQVADFG